MDEVKETETILHDDKDETDKGKVSIQTTKIQEPPNSPGDEFELTAEMMVNDFDDERTLDEEEALEEAEEQSTELSNLEKEKDMPIEDLLAMYGYSEAGDEEDASPPSTASEDIASNQEVTEKEAEDGEGDQRDVVSPTEKGESPSQSSDAEVLESESQVNQKRHLDPDDEIDGEAELAKKKIKTEELPPSAGNQEVEVQEADAEMNTEEDAEKEQPSMLHELYKDDVMTITSGSGARHLRSGSRQPSEEEEEEDDGDYSPDEEDWKKTIMVGGDYQAVIPDSLLKYDDAMPYENEDKLLWDPTDLSDKEIKDFLTAIQASQESSAEGINKIPKGSHVRDDEQALYLFLQCGLNPEEAIRRRTINNIPSSSSSSLWSEDECRNFESGLRQYGKDFHTIQQNRVRTRTVSELVQFYYLWKKTERHDVFAAKARLEKKKYILHPGTTDFMERFLDDQDSQPATSPNVHSLLSGDPKRQNKTPPPSQQQQQQHFNNNMETMGTISVRGPSMNHHHGEIVRRLDKEGVDSLMSSLTPANAKSTVSLPSTICSTPTAGSGGVAVGGSSEQKASTV